VGLNRGTGEIDIERSRLMFIDHIAHAAEQALRGTEYTLPLTFGRGRTAASTRSSTGTSRRTAASRPPASCSTGWPCRGQ